MDGPRQTLVPHLLYGDTCHIYPANDDSDVGNTLAVHELTPELRDQVERDCSKYIEYDGADNNVG
jgi:sulfite reductase alpha subunit-like flavoprotein